TNGHNFLIKGIETSLVARVVKGLTVQAAGSWNQSRQTNEPKLIYNNPQTRYFGKPLTEVCNSAGKNCFSVTAPYGPIGAPSANSPPVQFSLRARYEWTVNGYTPFVQLSA